MLGEPGGGLPLECSGTMRFFCTQFAGIITEDAVEALFPRPGKGYKGPSFRVRLFGYFWVACFLVWSTPAWLYPNAARSSGETFLPFSIFRGADEVAACR